MDFIIKVQKSCGVFGFGTRSITDDGAEQIRNMGKSEKEFIDEYIEIQEQIKKFKMKYQEVYS